MTRRYGRDLIVVASSGGGRISPHVEGAPSGVYSVSSVVAALIATMVVGGLIAAQPPINAELVRRSSDIAAALLSVAVSFVATAIIFSWSET
jgi:hypothetical protein